MVGLRSFLAISDPVSPRTPLRFSVPAVAGYTGLALVAMPAALAACTTVLCVCALLSDSERGGVVGRVVDVCNCCKKDREKEGRAPRPLKRLPIDIVQGPEFSQKGKPIRVCQHCDGELYEDALRAHKKRQERKA